MLLNPETYDLSYKKRFLSAIAGLSKKVSRIYSNSCVGPTRSVPTDPQWLVCTMGRSPRHGQGLLRCSRFDRKSAR